SPQATVVRFWPAISDSTRIKALADEIDQIALQAVTDVGLKKTLTATTVGEFLVFSRTMDRIVVTAALASIVTFLLIFGVLWAVYRNLVASLLSLLPVLFAAAVGLGALPVLGVELNALNGTVAVLAVGLGIDYSIQMMVRYQEELKKTATPEAAMQETYGRMVWPLGQAALMTTAGLFVLTGLLPITGSFGIAAALALLAAYGAAVLVLPLIAVRWVR
ncbi:MAG: MMPL family transporter, partial [bacterium]|nr:MMPL family transporter [bacterium]